MKSKITALYRKEPRTLRFARSSRTRRSDARSTRNRDSRETAVVLCQKMQIVHVFVEVKPDQVQAFQEATLANAIESRKEAGVIQFDFFQEESKATKFLLIEAYRDSDAPALHKQTAHYERWRDTVASMMAEQRYSIRYVNLCPVDNQSRQS